MTAPKTEDGAAKASGSDAALPGRNFAGPVEEIRPLIEDPLLKTALDYWESLRADAPALPSRKDLDPMAVPRLLPSILLIDVMPDDRFEYRLAGARIEERYQMYDFPGKTPQEALGADAEKVLGPYRLVRDERCLFYRDIDDDWLRREPTFKSYRGLLLPFTADGTNVTTIVGVFSFVRR